MISNKSSLGTDAVKLTTSKLITMMISLITAMLLSRLFTLEEYGTYSQILLIINLATTLFMVGLPNSINYFLVRAINKEEKQKFLSTYYTCTTILSIFTGLVLVLSAPIIARYFGNPLILYFIYVLAIFPWARIISSSIENVLIVYRKANQIMIFRVLNSVALLGIIVFVQIFNIGFIGYMVLFIIVETLFALSVYIIAKNISGQISLSIDKELLKKIIHFSMPIGLASVVGVLSIQLDKLVISRFFTVEELAIYTNAAREMPVTIVSSSLTAVMMPQLVRLLKDNRKRDAIDLWGSSIIISYAAINFFASGLFVYAQDAIALLYSDKYLPGVTVFRIYNLVLLLRFTYLGMVLNSIGKTKFILYSSIASLALNIVLNYIFYYIFGFIGPAIATFISILLIGFLQLFVTGRAIKIPFNVIFPWKQLSVITLINLVLGLCFAYIKEILPIELLIGNVLESIFLGAVWGVFYFLLIIRTIKENWSILRSDSFN